MTRRLGAFYPLLVAAIPILHLAAENSDQVELRVLWFPLAVAFWAAAIALVLLRAIYGDLGRAGIMVSALLFAFFSYGRLCDALWHRQLLASRGMLELAVMLGLLAALALVALVLWRRPNSFGRASNVLALTSLCLGLMVVGQLARRYSPPVDSSQTTASGTSAVVQQGVPQLESSGRPLPDIYYIILDGYARNDVLEAVYGFDNSAFTGYLKQRGFYVAERSHSNYAMTFLSLASSLNLSYVNDVAAQIGPQQLTRQPMYALIRRNLVARTLKSAGYRTIHIDTNWAGTETSEVADIRYSAVPEMLRGEFMEVLMRSTMLRPLVPGVAQTHLYALEKLQKIPQIEGPTFTFAHILLPHNPYVFDRHGNIRHDVRLALHFETKTGGWRNKRDYLGQLIFLNRKMREVIDRLIADSATPPVIIVQADHGSATYRRGNVPAEGQTDLIRERMPILNAYLVPDACKKRLYPSISPVNSFRLLFATLFGADLEPLPDRQYFSWYQAPYRFVDVTDMLGAEDAREQVARRRGD